jgi:hypothetical protein
LTIGSVEPCKLRVRNKRSAFGIDYRNSHHDCGNILHAFWSRVAA